MSVDRTLFRICCCWFRTTSRRRCRSNWNVFEVDLSISFDVNKNARGTRDSWSSHGASVLVAESQDILSVDEFYGIGTPLGTYFTLNGELGENCQKSQNLGSKLGSSRIAHRFTGFRTVFLQSLSLILMSVCSFRGNRCRMALIYIR